MEPLSASTHIHSYNAKNAFQSYDKSTNLEHYFLHLYKVVDGKEVYVDKMDISFNFMPF